MTPRTSRLAAVPAATPATPEIHPSAAGRGYLVTVARRLWISAGVVAVAFLAPVPAHSTTSQTRVLYHVTETRGSVAVDHSRFHNDGVLVGGVTRRDGAYRFHAVSRDHRYDRIRTPFHPSLNPGKEPFSYGARVKVDPNAEWSHSEMAVMRHGDSDTRGGDYKMELSKNSDGVVSAFCVVHDGDGDGSGYVQGHGELETLNDGQWHRIVCSRVSKSVVSLSIDGVVIAKHVKGHLGGVVGEDPLLIGCQFQRDGIHRREQFVGAMDDIFVRVQ